MVYSAPNERIAIVQCDAIETKIINNRFAHIALSVNDINAYICIKNCIANATSIYMKDEKQKKNVYSDIQ